MDPVVVAVFVAVYAGMVLGELPGLAIDRTGIALLGAIALLVAGRIDLAGAVAAVDGPTLALLFGLTRLALGLLLQSQADNTVRAAVFLADVVISPLLFLGAAIVYVDLAARVGLSRAERRRLRDAALGRPE